MNAAVLIPPSICPNFNADQLSYTRQAPMTELLVNRFVFILQEVGEAQIKAFKIHRIDGWHFLMLYHVKFVVLYEIIINSY